MGIREYTSSGRSAVLAVDQNLAADAPDIPALRERVLLVVQNCQHDSDVYVGLNENADTTGIILRRGSALNDGNGGSITLSGYTGKVWLYSSEAGGAAVRILEVGT
jgi:hypothetical protein